MDQDLEFLTAEQALRRLCEIKPSQNRKKGISDILVGIGVGIAGIVHLGGAVFLAWNANDPGPWIDTEPIANYVLAGVAGLLGLTYTVVGPKTIRDGITILDFETYGPVEKQNLFSHVNNGYCADYPQKLPPTNAISLVNDPGQLDKIDQGLVFMNGVTAKSIDESVHPHFLDASFKGHPLNIDYCGMDRDKVRKHCDGPMYVSAVSLGPEWETDFRIRDVGPALKKVA